MKVSNSMNCLGFAVGILLFFCAGKVEAQCGSPYTNVNSSALVSAGCTGVVIITGTLTVDANTNLSSTSITELRITGAGAKLEFGGNHILTLPSAALLSIVSGATITIGSPCNAQQEIVIGSTSATCNGTGTGTDFSFTQVINGKGFNAAGLPVELTSFQAALNQKTVKLNWQTASELNNAKFIIETSDEGELFSGIGEVQGAGTTLEKQSYQFTHHTPSAGINYYRLKQVDFDGTFEYSKVVAINAEGNNDIVTYPNPVKDKVYVQYDRSKGPGKIYLLDALGRRIGATINGNTGFYEINLPNELPFGAYWLKIERSGKVQTVAVVKE